MYDLPITNREKVVLKDERLVEVIL